ncbi:MAG: DUF4870 domain-containing protein [Conexivisphaera sp.]|jgi:uncharacterized membrane protein
MSSVGGSDSGTGNIIYLLTYLLTWITGMIVYVTEGQRSERVKFHTLQAIFLGVIAMILGVVLSPIHYLGSVLILLIWLYGMYIGYEAYRGTDVSVPVIGDYARKYSRPNGV